ncbi:capsular biosynthesis protein [Novosphingobium piscinae]|uniref:Capsular biosynthesis protein n=1 Tax=Novosphingobium piscinae TaxID=1507448 RepID=A0A7X1G0A8_9SPHN|nr:capsular biosynthesis protein [Novosphingobium piscinae]MBC2669587.1 capsular biosynthesis protein [Novosphingobium piscinae]
MTEQRKIIVPEDGTAPPDAEPAARRVVRSSVERAVEGFDLARLGGIVLPAEGRQRVVMRELSIETLPDLAEPVPATAAAEPQTPAAAAVPAATPVPPQLPEVPVQFPAVHHPIERKRLREQGLIVPEGTVSGLMEEFRIIKRQLLLGAMDLRRAGAGGAAQRVLICSPLPGEGKTYCATNLALAIAAEKESEVVLVDADFAKPSILSTLGLPGGPGLMDALTDPAIDVADCVIGTDVPGLWVLPAGNATNSDSEYLASSRTHAVLDRLTQGAPQRIVIFDSPPALAASPAAELAQYVGQAVVVARADRTGQSALEDAIALLSGCPNIQLLLNAARFSPSGRRFGSYYGYRG